MELKLLDDVDGYVAGMLLIEPYGIETNFFQKVRFVNY